MKLPVLRTTLPKNQHSSLKLPVFKDEHVPAHQLSPPKGRFRGQTPPANQLSPPKGRFCGQTPPAHQPSSILTHYPSEPYRLCVPHFCGTHNQHLIDNQRVAFHIEDGTPTFSTKRPISWTNTACKDGGIVTEMTSRVVYLQRMATLKVDLRRCRKRSTFTELITA